VDDEKTNVLVIVEPSFGERLTLLPANVQVWIVDTPINTPVVHRLWKERRADNEQNGITTFKVFPGKSREENFLSNLSTIDLHHGHYSNDPPYAQIEVIGASLSDQIKAALSEYGFHQVVATAEGFCAIRRIS
jgi:hypothetical protein